jgi:predicted chitinase
MDASRSQTNKFADYGDGPTFRAETGHPLTYEFNFLRRGQAANFTDMAADETAFELERLSSEVGIVVKFSE